MFVASFMIQNKYKLKKKNNSFFFKNIAKESGVLFLKEQYQ